MMEAKDPYYDIIADSYPELHREEQLKKLRIIRDSIKVKPSDSLLDVGCGPCFTQELFNCRITGIDPSRKLLDKAEKRPNLTLVQGFAKALPFPDNNFEIVISVTAVQNFSDIEKGISEMARVAKGPAAISCLMRSGKLSLVRREIARHFRIEKEIVEEKDIIFILRKF
jgi:ubiquinone/menaquinone biosynthesis C-methylase UbiE